MDIVFIEDLRIDTTIGINDWERKIKQTLAFDIEMAADISKAAQTEDIEDALNYKSVAKRIIQYVSDSECLLVETVVEQVAAIIREEFGVPWVKVTLSKLGAVRGSRAVGIRIERGTRP
ncbi:MAG TPA: dihydroneopterin aldolase [Gammaproteobacteria bacterium]|nr:dihydroneopterin aldolase [Gammaproteobacteria bacterium]